MQIESQDPPETSCTSPISNKEYSAQYNTMAEFAVSPKHGENSKDLVNKNYLSSSQVLLSSKYQKSLIFRLYIKFQLIKSNSVPE